MKVDHMLESYFISFRRTDNLPKHIEAFFEEFVDRIRKMDRNYIPDFCRMLSASRHWNIDNIKDKLNEWGQHFSKRKGTAKIIELVKRAFLACVNTEEINKLRGLILEAIVAACHGDSDDLKNSKYGWGAVVIIETTKGIYKEVKYKCPKLMDPTATNKLDILQNGCNNRQTIDFGYWDGRHAKLYECKVRPERIGCKEIKYLTVLKEELRRVNISNEIFFVSADSSENIIMNLKKNKIENLIKPLGFKELQKMMPA
jgi:hypothetical protein